MRHREKKCFIEALIRLFWTASCWIFGRNVENQNKYSQLNQIYFIVGPTGKLFWFMLTLEQLCPTRGPWAACDTVERVCVQVQVFAAVKVSYILTTCPYFDNLEFDIFDASGYQRHFITSVTIAIRIRMVSVQ